MALGTSLSDWVPCVDSMKDKMADEVVELRQKIASKLQELEDLKLKLKEKENSLDNGNQESRNYQSKLTNSEIARYSRQLILPEIGVQGQVKLKESSVLIVGVGGLGCPAALYLSAAGVGCIGLVDYDDVEVSNLHRQVLHSELKVCIPKVESAKQTLTELNSALRVRTHHTQLNSNNALEIISKYDVIVDATDNVPTRYLLNDACVLCKKPLISGSALRFEGQLTVYNYNGGPCYRCLFPTPPPPESVGNCSDNGVLGAVPGVIGTLQAIEVIKVICGINTTFSQKMLVFDALDGRFLQVKLRPKQSSCCICGESPTILVLQDYEVFCNASSTDKTKSLDILSGIERVTAKEYKAVLDSNAPHVLLDVREPVEMDICSLPNALNIPLRHLSAEDKVEKLFSKILSKLQEQQTIDVYVICRQGNDSQKAVQIIQENITRQRSTENSHETNEELASNKKVNLNERVRLKDIKGGLQAWARQVDDDFPVY